MTKFAFIFISLLSFSQLFAQSNGDTIRVYKSKFIYKAERLTFKELVNIVSTNPDAEQEIQVAKANNVAGSIFGGIGGALVGFSLGSGLSSGNVNWKTVGIGAGLIVVSIPFSFATTKHAKKAVRLYNKGLSPTGSIKMNLNVVFNGLGLKLEF